MRIIILILEILVASLFIFAATLKIYKSFKLKREDPEDGLFAPPRYIRVVSYIEIIASVLLVLPTFLQQYRVLTVISALTLIVIMVGAPLFHAKMGEHKEAAFTALLLFMLVFITFYQFFG